jgi:predicted GIY-YIG superfamily endonuclease
MHLDHARTALYRLHDTAGQLLYVGITHAPDTRWATHASTKTWWAEVSRKSVEWHENRALAEAAEKIAIRDERPLHNRADSPWVPALRPLEADEQTVGAARSNFSELLTSVRLLGRCVLIVGRGRKQVGAVVPAELGRLIQAAGGVERASAVLRNYIECQPKRPAEPDGP